MPIFQDSESPLFILLDAGDYILTVAEFMTDLSAGQATSGSERFNIVFNVEGSEAKIKESLIDHEKCIWKIDAFLKASGIRGLKKGQAFHFEKDKAESLGVPWINPMGLRCNAAIAQEKYTSQRSGNEVTKNVVERYYTDRDVLKPDPTLRAKLTANAEKMKKASGVPF